MPSAVDIEDTCPLLSAQEGHQQFPRLPHCMVFAALSSAGLASYLLFPMLPMRHWAQSAVQPQPVPYMGAFQSVTFGPAAPSLPYNDATKQELAVRPRSLQLGVWQRYPRYTTSKDEFEDPDVEKRKYREYEDSDDEPKSDAAVEESVSDSEESSSDQSSEAAASSEIESEQAISEADDFKPRADVEEPREEGSSESSADVFEDV